MTDRLYLPISQETLQQLLNEDLTESESFHELSIPEVASLVVLTQLTNYTKSDSHLANIERSLAGVIEAGVELKVEHNLSLQEAVKKKLSRSLVQSGMSLCTSLDIDFLPQEEVRAREYIDTEGRWDSQFTVKKNVIPDLVKTEFYAGSGKPVSLIGSQLRLYNEFKVNINEDLHVQGYAGTGKTHMLPAIVELLVEKGVSEYEMLALAYRNEQLKVLASRLPRNITGLTFGRLAAEIVPTLLEHPEYRRLKSTGRYRKPFNNLEYAHHYAIPPIGKYQPGAVCNCIYQTLNSYCASSDENIEEHHIPAWASFQLEEDKVAIISMAISMWELIRNPPKSVPYQMPLHDFHIIKIVALEGWPIPNLYRYVILDESHDISPAFAQILDNSPQTVISLGDEYQRLKGRQGARSAAVRKRQITRSYRVPHNLGTIVNAILNLHPVEATQDFVGNSDRETEIIYYEKAKIPDEPAAIWVQDDWEMLEWVQRTAGEGAEYRLIGSLTSLSRFVNDSLRLYKSNTPSNHFSLINLKNWSHAWQKNEKNRAFRQISRVFESGYTDEDWQVTQAKHNPDAEYVLGLYENARNQEFDTVMLAPSIVERMKEVFNEDRKPTVSAMTELSSKLYLGTTRTRQKLYAPIELRDFIEELGLASSGPLIDGRMFKF